MKVETSFTVDGNIVTKAFEGTDFIVYESDSNIEKILYLVSKKTGTVCLKQVIECESYQNTGYVESMKFEEFPV